MKRADFNTNLNWSDSSLLHTSEQCILAVLPNIFGQNVNNIVITRAIFCYKV